MMPMNNEHRKFEFLCLGLLLVLWGCPSDPKDVELEPDAGTPVEDVANAEPLDDTGTPDVDEGDTDDISEQDTTAPNTTEPDDVDSTDTSEPDDVDEPDPVDCTVPGGTKTLAEAVSSEDCEAIEIVDHVGFDDLGITDEPIEISFTIEIFSQVGATHFIEVPQTGLFELIKGAELELRDLVFTSADEGEEGGDPNPVISTNGAISLFTDGVVFENFDALSTAPILQLVDTDTIELSDTSIRHNRQQTPGILAIECIDSSVVLNNGSSIENNDIDFDDASGSTDAQILAVDGCDLTLDEARISNHSITADLDTGLPHASAVHCENAGLITLQNGSFLGETTVDITSNLAGDHQFHAAGLHLDRCDANIDDSLITENTIEVAIDDFDTGSKTDFEIEFGGAGIYSSQASMDIDHSLISENSIQFDAKKPTSDPTLVQLKSRISGAGLDVRNSTVQLVATTVADNEITVDLSGNIDQADGLDAGFGAGLSIDATADPFILINASTFARNSIEFTGDSTLEPDFYGAGLAFSTDDEGRLHLLNTTISGNTINGVDGARGAGLHIEASGVSGGLGNILPDDWTDDEHLAAILHYTTIADNHILDQSSHGAGLSADPLDSTDDGPLLRLLGVLLNDNQVDGALMDCSGATVFTDTGGTLPIGDSDSDEGLSQFNMITSFSPGANAPQERCSQMFGGTSGHLTSGPNFTLNSLDDRDGQWPTEVHIPDGSNPGANPIDEGEESACSHPSSAESVLQDQVGQTKPASNSQRCDIGSFETQ